MATSDWRTKAFSAWTLHDAKDFIATLRDDDADRIWRCYQGDHWQEGDGWIVPLPQAEDDEALAMRAAIKKMFTPEPLLAEALENHRDGVIAREPLWRYIKGRAPRPAAPLPKFPDRADNEDPTIVALEEEQTEKWDERDTLADFQSATITALIYGRAPLRLYVPSGLINEDGSLSADDFAAAIRLAYFDAPHPAKAGVYTNPDTAREIGVALGTDDDGREFAELSYLSEQAEAGMQNRKTVGGQRARRRTLGPYPPPQHRSRIPRATDRRSRDAVAWRAGGGAPAADARAPRTAGATGDGGGTRCLTRRSTPGDSCAH